MRGIKFLKSLSLAFDKFQFLNFVNMNIEKFAGINIVIAVTENFIFLTSSFILWIVNLLVLLF